MGACVSQPLSPTQVQHFAAMHRAGKSLSRQGSRRRPPGRERREETSKIRPDPRKGATLDQPIDENEGNGYSDNDESTLTAQGDEEMPLQDEHSTVIPLGVTLSIPENKISTPSPGFLQKQFSIEGSAAQRSGPPLTPGFGGPGPPSGALSSGALEALDTFAFEPPTPLISSASFNSQVASRLRDLNEGDVPSGTFLTWEKRRPGLYETDPSESGRTHAVTRLNVNCIGGGARILVLACSLGSTQEVWDEISKCFDLSEYRILLYDLPGSMSSDENPFDFQRYASLHGFADDLLDLLEEMKEEPSGGWRRPCTFVGQGVSAMLGLMAAAERPQSFERLILIGASARYLEATDYEGGFRLMQLDHTFGAAQENYQAWMAGLPQKVKAADLEPAVVREFVQPIFDLRPDIALCLLKSVFSADVRHSLQGMSVQCHLLHLTHFDATAWEAVQLLVDKLPNSYLEVLSIDSEHLRNLANTQVVVDAILRHAAMPVRPSGLSRLSSRTMSRQATATSSPILKSPLRTFSNAAPQNASPNEAFALKRAASLDTVYMVEKRHNGAGKKKEGSEKEKVSGGTLTPKRRSSSID
eukprot:TRINITY_DN4980_c0_g1_i1.p1 TRINITY_DN4980_c0_g1~~TRINITY_DN4980_c0_g1_i1.p1  ORF type:complete len:585 (+),score=87.05 TRINITY_DN4980_c0_g1_i1:299-2053(+)